jgi:hypothetical protein
MKLALTNKNGIKELYNWDKVSRVIPETGSRVFNSRIIMADTDRMFYEGMVKETTEEIDKMIDAIEDKNRIFIGCEEDAPRSVESGSTGAAKVKGGKTTTSGKEGNPS